MKELGENLQDQINEEEIGNLPEKEFRDMIVKMIQTQKQNGGHGLRKYKKCLTKIYKNQRTNEQR